MFGQTWTIGIEQKFYVVWPLLAFLPFAMGLGRRLGVLAGVFVVGALLLGSAAGFVVHYLVIALGCAMAVLMHDRRTYRFVVQLARPVVAGCCWLALAVYQLAVPALSTALGGQPLVVLGYGLLVALAMPSLLVLPAVTRVVSNRVATWWGERSYSLYLVQYFGALGRHVGGARPVGPAAGHGDRGGAGLRRHRRPGLPVGGDAGDRAGPSVHPAQKPADALSPLGQSSSRETADEPGVAGHRGQPGRPARPGAHRLQRAAGRRPVAAAGRGQRRVQVAGALGGEHRERLVVALVVGALQVAQHPQLGHRVAGVVDPQVHPDAVVVVGGRACR